MQWVVFTVSILIIGFYIFVEHKDAFSSLYWKTASSVSFLFVAVTLFQQHHESFQTIMLVGLIFGAIGDVLLALPFCYPKREPILFLSGLISFLLGHLCYVGALFHTSEGLTIWAIALSVIIGAGLVLIMNRCGIAFDQMLLPAMGYAIVIMFFELQCISWLLDAQTVFTIVLNIGSLLFVISDVILVFIVFAKRGERIFTIANLTTYYIAQLCLITTFLLW